MKSILKYAAGLVIATVILGVVALFVPPVWAMCKCTYNVIKTFLVFPGSFVAGLIVVFLAYLSVKKGHSYRKSFLISLICFVFIFMILGFLIHPTAEYINENDIPIFQPDFSNGLQLKFDCVTLRGIDSQLFCDAKGREPTSLRTSLRSFDLPPRHHNGSMKIPFNKKVERHFPKPMTLRGIEPRFPG